MTMEDIRKKRILIISDPQDLHAAAVAYAVRSKGHVCVELSCHDFPTLNTISLTTGADSAEKLVVRALGGTEFEYPEQAIDTIWLRHWHHPHLPDSMHSGDREIAQRQCDRVMMEFLAALADTNTAFWVNPPDQEFWSSLKLHQLRTARAVGLRTPETLVSNDPADTKAFILLHGGVAVHKLLQPGTWRTPNRENAYVAYTSPVRLKDLPSDATLRLCPAIYQPLIPKQFEVRTACFGDYLCSVQIDSQSDERAGTDWRAGQWYVDVKPYDLPENVADAVRRFLRALNVVHASLDFIVTPQGEHIFLEANVQGAFLWMEDRAGPPVLDMASDFLICARREFNFERNALPRISLTDFWPHWANMLTDKAGKHVIIDTSHSVLENV